jgi:hypothetical protein
MPHRFSSRVRTLVALFALGAASFGVSMLAEARHARSKKPITTDDCKTDKDCVPVPDDCCRCSEGGKQHAIPRKDKDAYEKDRKKRCAETACTEMVSTDPSCAQRPFCGAGICELGDAPADPPATP